MIFTVIEVNSLEVFQSVITNGKITQTPNKQDLALLEGKRLIKEALEAKCTLKNLIFSRKSDLEVLKPYLPKMGARLLKMPYKEIQMWSDLSTAPGVMGIFKTPEVENYVAFNSLPITIICDNIREPGNLGAILRTAAGAGIERLMLTKGCVDLWDTKVLRSACGAHFHMQIHKRMEWGDIEKRLKELESAVFVADNKIISEDINNHNFDSKGLKDIVTSMPLLPYYSVQFNGYKNVALILGGETEGISVESFQLVTNFGGARLNIPLSSCIESLNVGTALGDYDSDFISNKLRKNSWIQNFESPRKLKGNSEHFTPFTKIPAIGQKPVADSRYIVNYHSDSDASKISRNSGSKIPVFRCCSVNKNVRRINGTDNLKPARLLRRNTYVVLEPVICVRKNSGKLRTNMSLNRKMSVRENSSNLISIDYSLEDVIFQSNVINKKNHVKKNDLKALDYLFDNLKLSRNTKNNPHLSGNNPRLF
ncbi:hypothetical protein FQR65_LT06188 [Abscondita terminalis]|nr:hypothetical protein FQR65_LT06188 [Abscondita terminalis]